MSSPPPLRRLACVAELDLPNRKAHALQVVKNARAWSGLAEGFRFLTSVTPEHWRGLRDPLHRAAVARHFGIDALPPTVAYPFNRPPGRDPPPWRRHLYYRLAARHCRRWGAELVVSRTYLLPEFALPLGLAVVAETHSPPDPGVPDKERLYRQAAHPRFLALVTQSRYNAERFREWGVAQEKILVAPNGVDLEPFRTPLCQGAARAALGLHPTQPLAVYAGHLYPGRGIEEIFQAAARLPGVDFLLLGGHEADLERRCREVRAAGLANVILGGFIPNRRLPPYLWAADLLLMPYSRSCPTVAEMCPLKMLEYMAAGRAILATDLPALRGMLRPGENAWLVPPDDGPALAAGVARLLGDPPLARRLGESARRAVQDHGLTERVGRILAFAGENARRAGLAGWGATG